MSHHTPKERVVVTGAAGFIATHCIATLLRQGYHVRGTVRSVARGEALRTALANKKIDVSDRLQLVEADLKHDAGWADAMNDAAYVLHVASPFPPKPPKHESELTIPAQEGTRRILDAATEAGVRRVVLTSSVAAVMYGHAAQKAPFTEKDWSNTASSKLGAYDKSKTLAERAAWDWAARLPEDKRPELVTINPGLVLGPLFSARSGTSVELVKKLMLRQLPGCPNIAWPLVDVRDVAAAHVCAMTTPEASGKRFIISSGERSVHELASILQRHLGPQGYRIPLRRIPDIAVRIAALFDRTIALTLNDLGSSRRVSSRRAERLLNFKPRGLEEMVVDTADSLIEHGIA